MQPTNPFQNHYLRRITPGTGLGAESHGAVCPSIVCERISDLSTRKRKNEINPSHTFERPEPKRNRLQSGRRGTPYWPAPQVGRRPRPTSRRSRCRRRWRWCRWGPMPKPEPVATQFYNTMACGDNRDASFDRNGASRGGGQEPDLSSRSL